MKVTSSMVRITSPIQSSYLSVMPIKLFYNYSTYRSNVKLFSPSVGSGQTGLLHGNLISKSNE